ncbi:hypothetical protein B0T24DRAFT_337674 [Lasiosphaeria ovina]|uniref:Uncharacterized protein n=1 Tax=Lasiosphaeria ovina TaxID=92902 RepID=A0AAE0K8W7_9PEZI|nr:hypothetical protein B0T24DRAFT_337674 [Lasiosphaeria ovina]
MASQHEDKTNNIRSRAERIARRFSKWLKNFVEKSGDNGDGIAMASETCFVQNLISYRQNQMEQDKGEILEDIIRAETPKDGAAAWGLWYIEMCSLILRTAQDRRYSKTGDPRKEKAERNKMHACRLVNQIVNGLWPILQEGCLIFYRFFAEANIRLTEVSRLEERGEFVGFFVNILVSEISEGKVKIPESPFALYPAVLLAWLRGYRYQDVCRVIGLHKLAHLDMDVEVAGCKDRLLRGGVGLASRVALAPRRSTELIAAPDGPAPPASPASQPPSGQTQTLSNNDVNSWTLAGSGDIGTAIFFLDCLNPDDEVILEKARFHGFEYLPL